MIDRSKIKTLKEQPKQVDITYLRGLFDPSSVLEDLGIRVAFSVSEEQVMAHCPNTENHSHGDRNASFGFNSYKMISNCFVCGGESLLSLIKRIHGLTDEEAEQWLVDRSVLGTSKENLLKEIGKIRGARENDEISVFPIRILDQFKKLHPYLYSRGITREVAIKMSIGYDETHDAIVIPHIFKGQLLGWQWRHLKHEPGKIDVCNICGDFAPKYKNTKKFPKKGTLYNYDNVLQYSDIIVVESPFTALKLMSEGKLNVVATFGSWSIDQMSLLIDKKIYLSPDADKAGYQNLKNIVEYITRITPTYILPVLPDDKGDLADLSAEKVDVYLENCYSPIRFLKEKKLLTLEEI